MVSSPSLAFTLAATLAMGCLVCLLVPKPAPPILREPSSRQLMQQERQRRGKVRKTIPFSDPKTIVFKQDVLEATDNPGSADPGFAQSPVWWEDINYEQNLCGKAKCYFPRVSDPAKGYLVTNSRRKIIWKNAVKAYKYAVELESKYNIRHLLSSRPFQSDKPEYFLEHLTDQEAKILSGAGSLVVQESINAPKDSRLFKCLIKRRRNGERKAAKGEDMYDDLDYMIAHGNKGYEHVLLEEMSYTSQVVEYEPGLAFDFQFLIDLDGRIYHVDLDRVLKSPSHGWKGVTQRKNCLKTAAKYIISSMKQTLDTM